MPKIVIRPVIFTALISLLPSPVLAGEGQERAALARLLVELDALTGVVNDAENAAETQARYQFDYPALRRDLGLIRQGIADHIHQVRREPRKLPAVEGDFQRRRH